jgi:mannose-6-phosphate isomerase-like protein (cupin superfamily)
VTRVINTDALEDGEFQGHLYGNATVSFILVNAPPGGGPALHRHPYEEVFIVQEGTALFTAGEESIEVSGGHVVVVPPNTPHKFTNIGTGILRQVDIHPRGKFVTEWLDE